MYVALGAVLIVLQGFSPLAKSETLATGDHASPATLNQANPGHAQAGAALPDQYQSLLDFLKPESLRVDGVKAHVVLLGKDQADEKQISLKDAQGLHNWVQTFAKYRQGLATCELNADDKSAQLFGAFLDKFVAEVNHLTSRTAPDWKVSEKKVLAYIVEMERFLAEKKSKYHDGAQDYLKADDELKTQLEKTAVALFGTNDISHLDINAEIAKEDQAAQAAQVARTAQPSAQPSPTSAAPDAVSNLIQGTPHPVPVNPAPAAPSADIKAIHEEMNKAIAALQLRDGKVCSMAPAAPAPHPSASPSPRPSASPDRTSEEKKKDDDKNKTSELHPGPLQGGNPSPTASPTSSPTVSFPPQQPTNTLPNTNTGVQQPPLANTGDVFTPPSSNNTNPFDLNSLLQPFADQLAQQQRNADDQARQLQDLFNGLKNSVDDIARNQNQNQGNNDDGLAAALAALGRQQDQQQPQQQPPFTPPQISPPVASQQQPDSTPPFVPQQDPGQQQPPMGGMPMMPPAPETPPAPYYPPDKSQFDDSQYRPPTVIAPQEDPYAKMMQQWMMYNMARQQMMGPQTQNVNSIANRLQQMGPRPPVPYYGRPGALPPLASFATQSGRQGQMAVAPNARANAIPAALMRSSVKR